MRWPWQKIAMATPGVMLWKNGNTAFVQEMLRLPPLAAVCLATALSTASAYNNGVMKKPPMGWQTWCSVGPCGVDHCFDGQIRAMADTLVRSPQPMPLLVAGHPSTRPVLSPHLLLQVSSGMKDLGYNWIILDDWCAPCQPAPHLKTSVLA